MDKTSSNFFSIHSIFSLIIILFLFLLQNILYKSHNSLAYSPVFIITITYVSVLGFIYKLKYLDIKFISLFSMTLLVSVALSFILESFLNPFFLGNIILYNLFILPLGCIWSLNNPKMSWYSLVDSLKFYRLSVPTGIVFCIVAGSINIILSYLAAIIVLSSQIYSLKICAGIISFFLAFKAGSLLIDALIAIVYFFKTPLIMETNQVFLPEVKNSNYQTNIIYRVLLLICLMYLLVLPLKAYINGVDSTLYTMPIMFVAMYSIFELYKKKYDYETTVLIGNNTLFLFGTIIVVSAGMMFRISQNFTSANNQYFNNIWILSVDFNQNFYVMYTIFVLVVLSVLLGLNNITNSYNAFISTHKFGYTPFRKILTMLLFTMAAIYLPIASMEENKVYELSHFVAILVLLPYVSLMITSFIGYYVSLISYSLKKGE